MHKILSIIFLYSLIAFAQSYENIEQKAKTYFLSLSEDSSSSVPVLNELRTSLTGIDSSELKDKYLVDYKDYIDLMNHFSAYESGLKNISADSALFLFSQWYLHFSNTFYDYSDEKFFSSPKIKLILFSTSLSCYCTLDMCKKQAVEILSFVRGKEFDFRIIDAYEHDDLPAIYETLFIPSVVVLDQDNKLLHRIVYDELMIEKLKNFLTTELKENKI